MKTKYFVTATAETKLIRFEYHATEKAEAIAMLKNLSLRYKDAELFSIDSDDEEIVYNLTEKYL